LCQQAEYKQATGEDYQAAGASAGSSSSSSSSSSKEKKAKAPAQPPQAERTGPSKKELKKAEKKEKKAATKADGKQGGAGGAAAGNGGKPVAAAAAAGGKRAGAAVAAGVKEPTLYPGDESESTHMVLAVAHAGKVKLARGYGSKPEFVGKGPFLELPGGEVVSGIEGVVRAVALVREEVTWLSECHWILHNPVRRP
jgi:hypothetical protein